MPAHSSVLYGPDLYQGFQVMDPYFNQEIFHIMTHLQESVNLSQTGQLLRGTPEAFRLEIGVPFTLGTVNFTIGSEYTTDCWYKHMWKFADAQPIEIIEDFPDVPLLREGDSYLMTAMITAGYHGIQLKRLNTMTNYCCRYCDPRRTPHHPTCHYLEVQQLFA